MAKVAALAAVLAGLATGSRADAAPSAGREARAAWTQGKRALAAGRVAEATESLCKAMDLAPVPQHVIDCARARVAGEQWDEAHEILAPWTEADLDLTPLEARAISGLWKRVQAERKQAERKQAAASRPEPTEAPAVDDEPDAPAASSGGTPWPGIVTLGAAGLALGLGATFGLLASTTASDVRARCPRDVCPAEVAADAQTSALYGDIATASFVASGVLAASGVVLLFALPGDEESDRGPRASLYVAPTAAGVRGSF